MPPSTSFRALRSASRIKSHTAQVFFAPPRHFQPRRAVPSASAFRPFSSSFPRFSNATPPDPSRKPLYESAENQPEPPLRPDVPSYEMTFTCKPCSTRSTHRITKQGYHKGSILITCPECRNRHIISDHLNIFGDARITVEDLMRERGEIVKKGTLSEDGDVEFWEDGSVTQRETNAVEGSSASTKSIQ